MTNNNINNSAVKKLLDAVENFTTIEINLPEGRLEQLILLSEISQVLLNLNESLSKIVNHLFSARPSDYLKEEVIRSQENLRKLKYEIKEKTEQLQELTRIENENKQAIIEKTKLEEELNCKKDLASFNPSILDILKNEIGELEKAKPWITELKENRDSAREIIPQMVTVSAEVSELLGYETVNEINQYNEKIKKIQKLLEQYHTEMTALEIKILETEKNIKETKEEIEKKQEEYRKNAEEREKQITYLTAYLEADKEIAAAIEDPEARNAEEMLRVYEEQLKKVDQALKKAIDNNQKAKTRPNITL